MTTVKPLHLQRLIALPYLILGGWCLLAPHTVVRLMINPPFQHLSTTSALLFGCFGAQGRNSKGLGGGLSELSPLTASGASR